MLTDTTNELRVLRILAGCPDGATIINLVTLHAIDPATVYRLVDRGLVQPEERRIRPPFNYRIFWLKLTASGRQVLSSGGNLSEH